MIVVHDLGLDPDAIPPLCDYEFTPGRGCSDTGRYLIVCGALLAGTEPHWFRCAGHFDDAVHAALAEGRRRAAA